MAKPFASLREVRLETGEVIQQRAVNPGDFGEGLTEWRGRLVQLTVLANAKNAG